MSEKITLQELKEILADTAAAIVTPMRVAKDSVVDGRNIKGTASAYYEHLCEYPAGMVRAACDMYLQGDKGTFFPSVSDIQNNIREILRIATGIPTPLEAWAMIMDSARYEGSVSCQTGTMLRKHADGKIGGDYLKIILELRDHEAECTICHGAKDFDDFGHPAVTATVKRLGGKQYIITGNPTADRARWIEAYREIVDKEFRMITTSPSVKGYIESITIKPPALLESKITTLAARLSAPARKVSKGLPARPMPGVIEIGEDSLQDDGISEERKFAFDRGE